MNLWWKWSTACLVVMKWPTSPKTYKITYRETNFSVHLPSSTPFFSILSIYQNATTLSIVHNLIVHISKLRWKNVLINPSLNFRSMIKKLKDWTRFSLSWTACHQKREIQQSLHIFFHWRSIDTKCKLPTNEHWNKEKSICNETNQLAVVCKVITYQCLYSSY